MQILLSWFDRERIVVCVTLIPISSSKSPSHFQSNSSELPGNLTDLHRYFYMSYRFLSESIPCLLHVFRLTRGISSCKIFPSSNPVQSDVLLFTSLVKNLNVLNELWLRLMVQWILNTQRTVFIPKVPWPSFSLLYPNPFVNPIKQFSIQFEEK